MTTMKARRVPKVTDEQATDEIFAENHLTGARKIRFPDGTRRWVFYIDGRRVSKAEFERHEGEPHRESDVEQMNRGTPARFATHGMNNDAWVRNIVERGADPETMGAYHDWLLEQGLEPHQVQHRKRLALLEEFMNQFHNRFLSSNEPHRVFRTGLANMLGDLHGRMGMSAHVHHSSVMGYNHVDNDLPVGWSVDHIGISPDLHLVTLVHKDRNGRQLEFSRQFNFPEAAARTAQHLQRDIGRLHGEPEQMSRRDRLKLKLRQARQPVRLGHVPIEEIHPTFHPGYPHHNLGEFLRPIAAEGEGGEMREKSHSLLAEQILRTGDVGLTPILADALDEVGHPVMGREWAPSALVPRTVGYMLRQSPEGLEHPGWHHAIELGKRQILQDVRAGHVPASVRSFSDLHDHVDANYYGGAFEWPFGWEGESHEQQDDRHSFWNKVQSALHRWLSTGNMQLALRGQPQQMGRGESIQFARLRKPGHPVSYTVDFNASHGGGEMTYKKFHEAARDWYYNASHGGSGDPEIMGTHPDQELDYDPMDRQDKPSLSAKYKDGSERPADKESLQEHYTGSDASYMPSTDSRFVDKIPDSRGQHLHAALDYANPRGKIHEAQAVMRILARLHPSGHNHEARLWDSGGEIEDGSQYFNREAAEVYPHVKPFLDHYFATGDLSTFIGLADKLHDLGHDQMAHEVAEDARKAM